jgi:hypothetical protein
MTFRNCEKQLKVSSLVNKKKNTISVQRDILLRNQLSWPSPASEMIGLSLLHCGTPIGSDTEPGTREVKTGPGK